MNRFYDIDGILAWLGRLGKATLVNKVSVAASFLCIFVATFMRHTLQRYEVL